MIPFNDKILITTNTNGLFLYYGNNFTKFKTEADQFLFQNKIYNACKLLMKILHLQLKEAELLLLIKMEN
ncbi:MAG: hypothetical protein IPK06_00040 [Ignavibacteriae bacterium]|nr:hypothetical protein [Ignavibacteriota bacterium]